MGNLSDEELLALMAAGELPAAMANRFSTSDKGEIEAIHAACVRLHNTGAWDLLGLIERGELHALEGSDFFLASHTFGEILPELDADLDRVLKAVEALVARGGDDLASNQPNVALRAWCARRKKRAIAILDAARAGDVRAGRNLTFALEALQSIDEARAFLSSDSQPLQMSAVTALTRLQDNDPASRQRTLESIRANAKEADSLLRAMMLSLVASLLSHDNATVNESVLELIRTLTADPEGHIIHGAANALWTHSGVRRAEIFPMLLKPVEQVSAQNLGTVKVLDRALSALVKDGHGAAVVDWVKDLLLGSGDLSLVSLKAFLDAVIAGPPQLLARAVTTWLLTGEKKLCDGLAQALGPGVDDFPLLAVDGAVDGLTDIETIFVCRKAVGWFFMKPRLGASLIVAALRVCTEDVGQALEDLLVLNLLQNFGGLRDYLGSIDATDPAYARVASALERNGQYLAGLRDMPTIAELQPSEAQRAVQRARMADQSQAIAKGAREQSIIWKLAKHSVILNGRRSLSFLADEQGGLRRFELDMKSHGVSVEVPRMEIMDPVGLDYQLRVLRNERLIG